MDVVSGSLSTTVEARLHFMKRSFDHKDPPPQFRALRALNCSASTVISQILHFFQESKVNHITGAEILNQRADSKGTAAPHSHSSSTPSSLLFQLYIHQQETSAGHLEDADGVLCKLCVFDAVGT